VGFAAGETAEENIGGKAFILPADRGENGYLGEEVARFLGVTTFTVIRAAYSEELPELPKYL
jgi:hypothetical protein